MASVSSKTHLPIKYAKSDSYSPEDSLEDMVECLLSFENKFQWFDEVKNEIEKTCGIITDDEHCWTGDDIIRAWEETRKMVKDYTRNQWAYVITFQEMEMFNYDKNKTTEAQSDLTERGQDEQPRGSSQDSSDRPAETLSERIIEHNRRLEEDNEKAQDGSSPAIGINIPLSELFGREATSADTETVPSDNKLIDGCPSRNKIRRKKSYVMSYDENTKNAEWVYEILNKETVAQKRKVKGQFSKFIDIKGYTQGHLAAAANHSWCQEAYNGTFLFSNISPQISVVNRCMMNSLEYRCRKNITDKIRNIHVYTGPIIEAKSKDQRHNASGKAVPNYFFKVIIEEHRDGTVSDPIAYMITNDKTTLEVGVTDKFEHLQEWADFVELNCKTSVDHIKSISGLKFYVRDVQMVDDEIRSVMWTGEDGGGESSSAKIKVRIGK